jgi:hypothetical protein
MMHSAGHDVRGVSADAIRRKEVSSVEITARAFDRIDQHNPALNAFVFQLREEAPASAKKADEALAQGRCLGVFHGVPVHVKESFAVAGHPCTWGIPASRDTRARRNSGVVSRLLGAGAVLIGATNVPVNLEDWQSYKSQHSRVRQGWILAAIVAAVVGAGPGCAKGRSSHAERTRHGQASYRPLAEVEVVGETPPAAEEVTVVHPLATNQAPSYPDAALKAGCGDGLVPVRVHIGVDGRVSETGPVPGRTSSGDACVKEFEDAVRRAVGRWEFVPAYQVRRAAAETPGAEPTVERVPIGVDVDFEFVFSIVDGKGTVEPK